MLIQADSETLQTRSAAHMLHRLQWGYHVKGAFGQGQNVNRGEKEPKNRISQKPKKSQMRLQNDLKNKRLGRTRTPASKHMQDSVEGS